MQTIQRSDKKWKIIKWKNEKVNQIKIPPIE